MKDKELYRAGLTRIGIIMYRIKALECKKIECGVWFKRTRLYHPIGFILFLIEVALAPFVSMFTDGKVKDYYCSIYEQYIKGIKTT